MHSVHSIFRSLFLVEVGWLELRIIFAKIENWLKKQFRHRELVENKIKNWLRIGLVSYLLSEKKNIPHFSPPFFFFFGLSANAKNWGFFPEPDGSIRLGGSHVPGMARFGLAVNMFIPDGAFNSSSCLFFLEKGTDFFQSASFLCCEKKLPEGLHFLGLTGMS